MGICVYMCFVRRDRRERVVRTGQSMSITSTSCVRSIVINLPSPCRGPGNAACCGGAGRSRLPPSDEPPPEPSPPSPEPELSPLRTEWLHRWPWSRHLQLAQQPPKCPGTRRHSGNGRGPDLALAAAHAVHGPLWACPRDWMRIPLMYEGR